MSIVAQRLRISATAELLCINDTLFHLLAPIVFITAGFMCTIAPFCKRAVLLRLHVCTGVYSYLQPLLSAYIVAQS